MNTKDTNGLESGRISVHDNILYGVVVDLEGQSIVLHTYYPVEPLAYTDVIFEGVLIEHFRDAQFRLGNILFDVTEESLQYFIEQMREDLEARKNFVWPPLEYTDFSDLEVKLRDEGIRAFAIGSSLGLSGCILAKSCRRERRMERMSLRK